VIYPIRSECMATVVVLADHSTMLKRHSSLPASVQTESGHFAVLRVRLGASEQPGSQRFDAQLSLISQTSTRPLFNVLASRQLLPAAKAVFLHQVLAKAQFVFDFENLAFYVLGHLLASDGLRYQFVYAQPEVARSIHTFVFAHESSAVIMNIASGDYSGNGNIRFSLIKKLV